MHEASQTLYFEQALLPSGWRQDVRLTIKSGVIAAIETDVHLKTGDACHAIGLPGVANLHSHAFQRAMSGLAEQRGPGDDTFWSWRETMFRFALSMNPEQVEAVAAQAYVEMLEAGYTSVGEFHYLHHAPDGRPYANTGEMAERIAAAAQATHIGLTLLPVFYAHSGFGGAEPTEAQRRFICNLDLYARLVEQTSAIARAIDGGAIGIAPHSLRAATQDELAAICGLSGQCPLHIHIAEQVAEVDASIAWSGARPVDWLLDHAQVDKRWCLVHATHMTPAETRRVAASGAIVGLCPITEANLGDGVFPAQEFIELGGRLGVGTDSNVQIAFAEELRLLEYSQRLTHRARNVLAISGGSTGRALFDHARAGGAAALGRASDGIIVGADADIVTLKVDALDLIGRRGDALLDAWIFSRGNPVDCVYARGRLVVRDGAHLARGPIGDRFRATMIELLAK